MVILIVFPDKANKPKLADTRRSYKWNNKSKKKLQLWFSIRISRLRHIAHYKNE